MASKFEYAPALSEADKFDYLLVPKGQRGGSPDLLVTDMAEGFWVLTESCASVQVKQVGDIALGKVQYMGLNSKKNLLAVYSS